jgi:hypothetical protein
VGGVEGEGRWRTLSFRVIRSSWGIAVDLTARGQTGPDRPVEAIRVGSKTWLNLSALTLPLDDTNHLVWAARRVADQVEAARPMADVTIEVHDVKYPLTDYQPEGVAAALIGWVVEEFDLEHPPIEITFDAEANRYVFAW